MLEIRIFSVFGEESNRSCVYDNLFGATSCHHSSVQWTSAPVRELTGNTYKVGLNFIDTPITVCLTTSMRYSNPFRPTFLVVTTELHGERTSENFAPFKTPNGSIGSGDTPCDTVYFLGL
jgi:hypothetical protein